MSYILLLYPISTAGSATLPFILDATKIDYSGPCDDLDTTEERAEIGEEVQNTLKKSVIYNDDLMRNS